MEAVASLFLAGIEGFIDFCVAYTGAIVFMREYCCINTTVWTECILVCVDCWVD